MRRYDVMAVGALVILLGMFLARSWLAWGMARYPASTTRDVRVETSRGTLVVSTDATATAYRDVLDWLLREPPPEASLPVHTSGRSGVQLVVWRRRTDGDPPAPARDGG